MMDSCEIDIVESSAKKETHSGSREAMPNSASRHPRILLCLLLSGLVFLAWLAFDSTRNFSVIYWQADFHQYRYLEIGNGRISAASGHTLSTVGTGWQFDRNLLDRAGSLKQPALGSIKMDSESSVFVAIWFFAVIYIVWGVALWIWLGRRRRHQDRLFEERLPDISRSCGS